MRSVVLLLIVALLSAACAPTQVDLPGSATVDPGFTASQTEVILQAFDAWREATHGVATMSVSVGTGGELHVRPARMDGATMGLTTFRTSGATDTALDLQTVWLAARVERVTDDEALLDTTMHELGHAFGLDHVPGGLMRAEGYGGGKVDPGTLARFCENYRCNR